ncbi:hypothetical protein [Crassaminicella indica]|uniref:Hook-length control protein FliK n=1 Tax=Crassaminicella indica TaxID=2855394 RepID=A0ABX8R9R7_9CLOT|nr:hypothetical protein [Crassaminicella indica]QXM05773.1 hypothetical protein KVH43_10425 [Crassaminicella indica]
MKINPLNYNLGLGNNKENLLELKMGQIITGKIQQILNDVLILEMNSGKLLEAKTAIPLEAQTNDVLKFQVKSIRENKVILQPMMEEIDNKEEMDNGQKKIISLLKELNIKPGEEEIELVKKLIANRILVSKENLTNIIQLKSNFEKIETLINTKSIPINEKIMNEHIREVLKELLKEDGYIKENEYSKDENIKNIVKDSYSLELEKNMQQKLSAERSVHSKNINPMSYEKIIFLLKNNLKMNIMNLKNINNLLMKEFTVSKQMDELIGFLYKNDETAYLGKSLDQLFSNIKDMIFEKNFEPHEIMKEIHIKLEMIKQSIENISSKDQEDILNNITNLKNSLDFMNKLNPLQTYFQIPIFFNDERRNIELFISKDSKNKKKINPKDVKILIALDTKTMDRVQVLIEIKDKNIMCNFKVKTDEIKKKLLAFEKDLKEILMHLGFTGINTKYAVSNTGNDILEEALNKKEIHEKMQFIDLKV